MENNQLANVELEDEVQLIPMLKRSWRLFLLYWKWFVVSVLVCVALGYVYLQRQPRVYMRQAVMLIEDADPSGSVGGSRKGRGNMGALMELNGISVGDNMSNEKFILTSHRLMERVVDCLNLNVDYTTSEGLHRVSLYRHRPFEVVFRNSERPLSFSVTILDDATCRLGDFKSGGEEYSNEKIVKIGSTVATPVGTVRIMKNLAFEDFPVGKKVTVTRIPRQAAVAKYRAALSASEFDKESSLIVLACSDVNRDRADDIINEIFNAYKRDVVDNKNRVAQSTAAFIDSRIDLIGFELSKVENQLASFKQRNRIIDFQTSAQIFMQESSSARQKTMALETQLAVARYLADYLRDNSRRNEVIPVLTGLDGASFTTQIAEYNKFMLNRNMLAENSSETSPKVKEYDTQLAALRQSILSSVNSYVSSTELALNESRGNETQLSGKVGAVPEQEKYAIDIQRQQSLKEALYTFLLNKREEVALQMAINEANVRLVEAPMGSGVPVSPRGSIIMLISLLVGILIPVGVLWIKTLLDVTISDRNDVEKRTTIPLVGEIPHWKTEDSNALLSSCDGDAPVVEAFRVLRYGLNFMKLSAKVFVTTSTTPNQGKSFISRNLAVVLAMAGKKVLLIDADIRKRTQSHIFGKREGLTTFLAAADKMNAADVIVKDAVAEGVDFLPAGMVPPNPAELLMSQRLEDLIEQVREMYDYVLIDTTPLMSVADASIVSRVSDMTLYVMRVGHEEKSFLPQIEKMYQDKKFHNLCIVLNDCDSKPGYSSYGYGYGYGYGNGREKKKRGLLGRLKK